MEACCELAKSCGWAFALVLCMNSVIAADGSQSAEDSTASRMHLSYESDWVTVANRAMAEPVKTHFLWRPQLRDPGDEMVLGFQPPNSRLIRTNSVFAWRSLT
jgi:hypothetical protein